MAVSQTCNWEEGHIKLTLLTHNPNPFASTDFRDRDTHKLSYLAIFAQSLPRSIIIKRF